MMDEEGFIFIGILEESVKRTTFFLLKEFLNNNGFKICYENLNKDFVIFNKENNNIFIFDIESEKISSIIEMGIYFHLIIHTFNNNSKDSKIIKNLFINTDFVILNCDEEKWTYFFNGNTNSIVITYGFNNKATVNISSYYIHDYIEANICLQRKLFSIKGKEIDPFELPVKVNSQEKLNIYPVIAIVICGLLINLDISKINNSIFIDKYP